MPLSSFASEARRMRLRAIAKYGGKCCRCGFSDWRALHFDHVDGGGNQERLHFGNVTHLRKIIAAFGNGQFQLLCSNCNWIKRCENKEFSRGNDREVISLNESFLEAMRSFEPPLEISFC